MEDTLYDLVIRNINGSKLTDTSHFSASIVTRSQAGKDEHVYKKLKVPDQTAAKAGVAPTISTSIPRLELMAAVVRARSYLNSSLKLSDIVRGLSCQQSYCN